MPTASYGSIPAITYDSGGDDDSSEDDPVAVIDDALSHHDEEDDDEVPNGSTGRGSRRSETAPLLSSSPTHPRKNPAVIGDGDYQDSDAFSEEEEEEDHKKRHLEDSTKILEEWFQTVRDEARELYSSMYAWTTSQREPLQSMGHTLQDYALAVSLTITACWTNLVFAWFTPLLDRGNAQKKLDPEDMDLVPFPDHCDTQGIFATFEEYWQQELQNAAQQKEKSRKHGTKSSKQPQPSLVTTLIRAFGREFAMAGLLKFIHDSCIFVGPQVLNAMIYYLRDAQAPVYHGLGLTLLVTSSQLAMSFCLRHYFFKCYMVGLKLRTAMVVAVYQKALVLAAGERQTRTVGEITNLMSIDAKRLQGTVLKLRLLTFSMWKVFSNPI
jgi:hypothetical protein